MNRRELIVAILCALLIAAGTAILLLGGQDGWGWLYFFGFLCLWYLVG